MNAKILTAPNGVLIRADHIISVSPIIQSSELGTDGFEVYVIGSEAPYVFAAEWAPDCISEKKRKEKTVNLRQEFVDAWAAALGWGTLPFSNN